jgi:threonine synthase
MLYQSTRGGQSGVPFEQVLLSAYASDGGLFVPESLPLLSRDELCAWAGLDIGRVCARIMALFTDLSLAECEEIAVAAFATFNPDGAAAGAPALPLARVGDLFLLDASLGPTLSFKDVGQQVVGRLLDKYLGRSGRHVNIVVETSGDTGPAAIAAVAECEHVSVFCLYPRGRTSEVQELQMITVDAPNVTVFRTEGDTDEQVRARLGAARVEAQLHHTPIDPFQKSARPPHSRLPKLEIERIPSRKQSKGVGARKYWKGSIAFPLPHPLCLFPPVPCMPTR